VTLLGGLTRNYRDALTWLDVAAPSSPDTFYRINQPRIGLYDSASDTGQVALATGVMTAVRIKLFAGDVITNISVRSGATAAGTPTNYWVALYSNAGHAGAAVAVRRPDVDGVGGEHHEDAGPGGGADDHARRTTTGRPIMVTATTPPTLLGSIAVAPIVTGEANLSVSSGARR
jgi:hypothetical protein